ncbi:MAG: hypothetical protein P8X47_01745 [Ignavibacteriaceae bacterium]
MSRPIEMQKSIVSPSGFFRVHFDTTNSNGNGIPSYVQGWSINQNVTEVAKALDSAYNFEVNYLGFLAPPQDNAAGGDFRYDVYIIDQSSQIYGYTEWENKVGQVSWTSFMVIDNDYSGYYSSGLDGMRVTVAHEFHHGIQIGNYAIPDVNSPVRLADSYFYELTSTSMEEFVYDDVNDYYAYMHSYFSSTYKTFPNHIGYDMAIWNIFLVKNFGFDVLINQWEAMPSQRALYAINSSLYPIGTSFQKEYNKFGIWTYFTSYRAIPGLYFDEALFYPVVTPLVTVSYPQFNYAQVDAYATSNNFLRFGNVTNGDTLFSIITNGDINSAVNEPNTTFSFTYTLFSDTISGNRKLADRYSADFSLTSSTLWSISEILNDVVVLADSIEKQIPSNFSYAYPNPFNYKSNFLSTPLIFFPFESKTGETVDFAVYSVGMQLMFSSELPIQNLPGDQKGVSWNGLDKDENNLASGVYIYVIKRGDDILKGKFVIFNE